MEILPHPLSATRPMFLLPDRCPRLDLVDQVSRGFECVASVRGRDRDRYRDLADSQLADAMDRGHSPHRPAVPNLGDNFGDLVDDLLVVGLVLEMRHAGPSGRVIAHGPDE